MINQNTAILIFTRTHQEESRVKVFSSQTNQEGNAAIAEKLIQHSISTAQKSNFPVFPIFDTEQIGHSFGERLANAVESIYDKGYENVIIIGNDCPQISPVDFLSTSTLLEKSNLVCGPATDGGLYLLGMAKSVYSRDAFIDLAWEEKNLQEDIEEYAEDNSCTIEYLGILQDIDNESDFRYFLSRIKNKLRRELMRIIASFQRAIFIDTNFLFLANFLRITSLRGPPR
jgi:2-phospho-L-lactate guanylyltransferase (CobY/MobA/RfbA family)